MSHERGGGFAEREAQGPARATGTAGAPGAASGPGSPATRSPIPGSSDPTGRTGEPPGGRLDLSRPSWEVAPTLLGAVITRGPVSVRLVEVEAYDGANDPASHAYRGKTARNFVMFGPSGHLYVYFTYGMHHACNVSCGPDGVASGVLLRAGEVVAGLEVAQSRRGRSKPRDLARGPGRLAQALGIDRTLNGTPLLDGGEVTLTPAPIAPPLIEAGPRVGVSAAADVPWRFWIPGDPHVSVYKRSPRAGLTIERESAPHDRGRR